MLTEAVMTDEEINDKILENAVMRISQALTEAVNTAASDEDGNRRGLIDYRREMDGSFAGSIDFIVLSEKTGTTLSGTNTTCAWVGPMKDVVHHYANMLDIDPVIVGEYITMGWRIIKAAYPTAEVVLHDSNDSETVSMFFYANGIYFAVYLVAYPDPSNNNITYED